MSATAGQKTPHPRGLFFTGTPGAWVATVVAALLACILPFVPGLAGPFQLDDTVNLLSVNGGDFSLSSVYHAAFNNTSGPIGRPLSALTFIANQFVHGYSTTGYKLTNLALHFGNGLVVYALASQLLLLLRPGAEARERRFTALVAAALWTIHPLQVSTALYVVQRMTELASGLMALSVLVALRALAVEGGLPRAGHGLALALKVGAIAFIALLCKETAVLVPFLLLAARLSMPSASLALVSETEGKRWFWRTAAFAPAVAAALLATAFWGRLTAGYVSREFTLAERLLTEPLVLVGYLKSFFLPDLRRMGLFLDATPTVDAGDPIAWLGVAGLVAVLAVAHAFRRRFPVVAFAAFWFVACHLLESSFIAIELAFEHRNYLALLGPCLLLATGITALGRATRPRVAVLVVAAVLATFGGITFMRASNWSTQDRFLESSLRHHPESVRAQTEYAVLESMQGANEAAMRRIAEVRREHPDLFFPAAMDMDFACAEPGYDADWSHILSLVRANPRDRNITTYYKAIASRVLGNACKADIREPFARHLAEVAAVYRHAQLANETQFFLLILADFQADPERARALLNEAAQAAPSNPAALYRIAYFELNEGDLAGAEEAIRALEARVEWWRPSRHRVRELQHHLKDLRRQQLSG